VQPLLSQACATATCHDGQSRKAGLDLTEGKAWAETVGVSTLQCGGGKVLVVPGQPSASYLLQKMRGQGLCGGSEVMPPQPEQPLGLRDIEIVSAWICQGARED